SYSRARFTINMNIRFLPGWVSRPALAMLAHRLSTGKSRRSDVNREGAVHSLSKNARPYPRVYLRREIVSTKRRLIKRNPNSLGKVLDNMLKLGPRLSFKPNELLTASKRYENHPM